MWLYISDVIYPPGRQIASRVISAVSQCYFNMQGNAFTSASVCAQYDAMAMPFNEQQFDSITADLDPCVPRDLYVYNLLVYIWYDVEPVTRVTL